MIIATLTYKKPLSEVDKFLSAHVEFLDKFYAQMKFLASGRRENRIGGVIIILSNDLKEAETIIAQDPFYQQEIADYQLTYFEPSKFQDEIKTLI